MLPVPEGRVRVLASRTVALTTDVQLPPLWPQVMVCVWEVGVLLWLPFLAVFLSVELALWSANLIKVGAEARVHC